jgi:excisionase family DNA binding protein
MAHNAISQPNEAGGLLTEPLLNTTEGAAVLNVSKRTFQELAAAKKFASIKFGRNVRFARADLERFIESHRSLPVGWKVGGK